jgi:hypothetical protein
MGEGEGMGEQGIPDPQVVMGAWRREALDACGPLAQGVSHVRNARERMVARVEYVCGECMRELTREYRMAWDKVWKRWEMANHRVADEMFRREKEREDRRIAGQIREQHRLINDIERIRKRNESEDRK